MRSLLILFSCFIFGFCCIVLCCVSYGDFSYDIDSFTVVGGSDSDATFIDEFDDGEEPPSGPNGPLTYKVEDPIGASFSSTAENDGFLNLNSNDAKEEGDESSIGASLNDNTFFINSDVGGEIEGKFRFTDGIKPNSGFNINISPISSIGLVDNFWFGICSNSPGNITARIDGEVPEDIIVSEEDISESLMGITEVTLKLDISTSNAITASLDFGSDGTFDLIMPGSHNLSFRPGISGYTGGFEGWEEVEGTGGKSFTFNCEHSLKKGFFFGLERLTMNVGDTENCTLKLTNHEPGKTVKIATRLRKLFGSAIEIEQTSGETDENGELEITITALSEGINWATWAVPNDRGQFRFNKKTYDTGLAWGMFVEVK